MSPMYEYTSDKTYYCSTCGESRQDIYQPCSCCGDKRIQEEPPKNVIRAPQRNVKRSSKVFVITLLSLFPLVPLGFKLTFVFPTLIVGLSGDEHGFFVQLAERLTRSHSLNFIFCLYIAFLLLALRMKADWMVVFISVVFMFLGLSMSDQLIVSDVGFTTGAELLKLNVSCVLLALPGIPYVSLMIYCFNQVAHIGKYQKTKKVLIYTIGFFFGLMSPIYFWVTDFIFMWPLFAFFEKALKNE